MSKLIKVNINITGNYPQSQYPSNIYTGLTIGDVSDLVYENVVDPVTTFQIEDGISSFFIKLVSDGCLDQTMEVLTVDCQLCGEINEFIPVDCTLEGEIIEFEPPTTTPTPTPTPTEVPGEPASCDEGMDVVFLIDYTGSMGGAINGIKTTISSIVDTIVTESNDNYRLGLVIYDEYADGTTSNYSNLSTYTSLPSNQKFVNTGIYNRYQWITSLQKMSLSNRTDFTNKLNLLNNSAGGGWPIGSGIGGPEPADIGVDVIATNDVTGYEYIAGEFRGGVSKLIILITDNSPSGNDDNYTQVDIDYINTLIPKLVNQNIRVLLMTTYGTTALNTLAIQTNGLVNVGFTGSNIITAIENICIPDPTPTPTPTPM